MVNSQMINEVTDAFKLDLRVDKIPQVIPVCEVNPKLVKNIRIATQTATNSTSGTILSANANQDVYIWGGMLSMIKDAAALSTFSQILMTDEYSLSRPILRIQGLASTAQMDNVAVFFNHPIKIQRNTPVTINNQAADANVSATAVLYYSIDEVN